MFRSNKTKDPNKKAKITQGPVTRYFFYYSMLL